MFILSIVALVLIAILVVLFVATFIGIDKADTTDIATHNTTAKKEEIAMKNFELMTCSGAWSWGRQSDACDAQVVWRRGDEYIQVLITEDQPDFPEAGWCCTVCTEDGSRFEFGGSDYSTLWGIEDALDLRSMGIDAVDLAFASIRAGRVMADRFDVLQGIDPDFLKTTAAFFKETYAHLHVSNNEVEDVLRDMLEYLGCDLDRFTGRDRDKLIGLLKKLCA